MSDNDTKVPLPDLEAGGNLAAAAETSLAPEEREAVRSGRRYVPAKVFPTLPAFERSPGGIR